MARLTREEIINKFKSVHGDRYDYSEVEYIRRSFKVKIKCNIHGVFEQSPDNHIAGKGCRLCGNISQSKIKTKTTESFIRRSKSIHGNEYDYSKSVYKRSNIKLIVTCIKHGDFLVSPGNHLKGKGCPDCGRIKISKIKTCTNEIFIEKSISIHGNKYDYSLVNYVNARTKVIIVCKVHGEFEQTPVSHLNSKGCLKCSRINSISIKQQNPPGWNVSLWNERSKKTEFFDSFKVYVIKCWNESETFYKIGRTFMETKRRFRVNVLMPYNYEILKEFIFETAKEAFNKETELKRKHKELKYLPRIKFAGRYECFSEIID